MRAKSLALLALALGCGLVASMGITQVLAKRGVIESHSVSAEAAAIYVAVKDIAQGDALNAQSLKMEQWPKDKVPTGGLSNMDDIEGRLRGPSSMPASRSWTPCSCPRASASKPPAR